MPSPERSHRAPCRTLPARAADLLTGMESLLAKSKTSIVIDHMGLPDAATRRAILTDNPERLYGF